MNTQVLQGLFVPFLGTTLGAALVFFMQAGFAMVETGFTRAKNAGNIIMKNLMDFAIGTPLFWLTGFGIMFGGAGALIGGFDPLVRGDYSSILPSGVPLPAFLIFQTVFCATAATIVSGAMAERTKFISYCIYSAVISAVVYPISGHWIWGGGWLAQMGFHDFAGSTAVHMCGGLRDEDLFPLGSTKLNGVKFYGKRSPDEVVSLTASLITAAGGGLVPVFQQLMKNRSVEAHPVKNFQNYGTGGIGGEVCGEPVLLGSLNFLQDMGVVIPEGTMVNQAVYAAIDGQLCAVFAISYAKMRSAAAAELVLVQSLWHLV